MMLTGSLFLLLLSGGWTSNSSDLEDQRKSNQSFEEGGSTPELVEYFVPAFYDRGKDKKPLVDDKCTHRNLLRFLSLNKMNVMTRPGSNDSPTKVDLDVLLYAILDVNEKDQKFVSYIWVDMIWDEADIFWDPGDFCNITQLYLPTNALWRPDLTIEEMTEKDKALQSPYLIVYSDGRVIQRNDMMVISTCQMEVYKFPFDVQSCDLSFKSAIHSDEHLQLVQATNSSWNIAWSRKMMAQSEWLFINMTINSVTVDNFGFNQSMLVYTITMGRRSALYIANFLLPIMFFFSLDLASFLISDSGGEKLSFKVTVLLAVTVMQLILNEILPSSSDRIPLIAVYCIGIFGLMMVSLLETILVMYLIEKDSQDNQVNSSQLTEESSGLEKVSGELKEVEKTLTELLNNRKEERKPGYWTRVTKTINRVFFVCYVTGAALFLAVIFSKWNSADEE